MALDDIENIDAQCTQRGFYASFERVVCGHDRIAFGFDEAEGDQRIFQISPSGLQQIPDSFPSVVLLHRGGSGFPAGVIPCRCTCPAMWGSDVRHLSNSARVKWKYLRGGQLRTWLPLGADLRQHFLGGIPVAANHRQIDVRIRLPVTGGARTEEQHLRVGQTCLQIAHQRQGAGIRTAITLRRVGGESFQSSDHVAVFNLCSQGRTADQWRIAHHVRRRSWGHGPCAESGPCASSTWLNSPRGPSMHSMRFGSGRAGCVSDCRNPKGGSALGKGVLGVHKWPCTTPVPVPSAG